VKQAEVCSPREALSAISSAGSADSLALTIFGNFALPRR
jgi:hypothetical protein